MSRPTIRKACATRRLAAQGFWSGLVASWVVLCEARRCRRPILCRRIRAGPRRTCEIDVLSRCRACKSSRSARQPTGRSDGNRFSAAWPGRWGNLPDRTNLDIPTVEVKESQRARFTRQTVKSRSTLSTACRLILFAHGTSLPAAGRPAVLALHQTVCDGQEEVDGRDEKYPDQRYGRELAERGYVVLAPDYPSFGDYPCDFSDPRFASGTMLGVFNHMRCIDWFVAREDVDAGRIGVIGHSLGGHNAMFLAAWDERVKATVSSCGWDAVSLLHSRQVKNWGQDRIYAPGPHRVRVDPAGAVRFL